MLEGNAFVDQFNEEKIRDQRILEYAKKVEVYPDEEIENLPRNLRYTVKVQIELNDGRVFNLRTEYPKGHPLNPFTEEELLWKFDSLAGKVFDCADRRKKIVDAVMHLEDLDNVKVLTNLLRKEA